MCDIARDYFDALFQENSGQYEIVTSLITPCVNDGGYMLLLAPFLDEEFRVALF